ncbi:Rqc2 family fibronectin-binding protein [Gorillibacterium sp. sgz5001074]|uniref:Rqc2 family fibronectin-binding protein n=1 Tax=Gorillibacterium sp. sgz5001074 TaxID=3446695 RepID=UPI003F672DF8
MALDGLVVHALVRELQACVGGRINKIHQPSDHDIVIQLRAQGANRKLLLSANPTYPRAHFTEQTFMNPFEAPMFCMLLRKHCESAVIEAVEQVGMERMIRFRTRQLDELGDVSVKHIVMELMGRHSNLILMDPDTGIIQDGIHHVTPAISSHRIVLPGSAYVSPPDQGKANPLETDFDGFLHAMEDAEGRLSPEQRLVDRFSGLSPLVAKEIVHRSFETTGLAVQPEHLWPAFESVMSDIRQDRFIPNMVTDTKGKAFFSVIELTHVEGERRRTETVSGVLELYYGDKAERDTVKQRTQDLLRFLQNERNKNVKKLEKLADTMEEARNADRFRILGELVTGHLHVIKRGDKEVEAVNYYDEDQATVKIALDPLLNPSENAQRYYKKYTKMKNSLIAVQEQIVSTNSEIAYLESLLQQLDNAAMQDIEEIRDELVDQGYLRDRNKKARRKKKNDKPVVACFTSSEGIPIYVGKNNTQNEYLTNRLAQASDTWLHTKDIPGSHVVIRSATYGDATLNEASQLAAYYSQAKSSSQVPVDYTLIRHVRKPSGAKPGFVIYDHQKTLFITPDEQLVKSLRPAKGT